MASSPEPQGSYSPQAPDAQNHASPSPKAVKIATMNGPSPGPMASYDEVSSVSPGAPGPSLRCVCLHAYESRKPESMLE